MGVSVEKRRPFVGRIVIGGYGDGNLNIHIADEICRAMQSVALTRLLTGQGLFLRYAGILDDGQPRAVTAWISPSSSLRFEYDGDVMPDIDPELVSGYQEHVDSFGGMIIASEAERVKWAKEAEDLGSNA